MNLLSIFYYRYKKILKTIRLYLIIAGPGIIVMVADNDAGGNPESTMKQAADAFIRYGFRALPVTDKNDIILGVVPYRDVMNLKHRILE